jgi:hypothetical protein
MLLAEIWRYRQMRIPRGIETTRSESAGEAGAENIPGNV